MHATDGPALNADEIDDCLYLARVNEEAELNQCLAELAQKYNCKVQHIVLAAKDPESGNTILHYVSANGFLDLLKGLLVHLDQQTGDSNSADSTKPPVPGVNAANKEGNTPLHWASLNGHLDSVKLLVQSGADVCVHNAAGHSAAFEAERAGKGLVVEYLMEAGGLEMDLGDLAETENGDGNDDGAEDGLNGGGDEEVNGLAPSD